MIVIRLAHSLLNFDLLAKLFWQIGFLNDYRAGPAHINLGLFGCRRHIRFPVHLLAVHIPISTVAWAEMVG